MPFLSLLKYCIFSLAFAVSVQTVLAQTVLTNNACVFFINEQAIVRVNGDVHTKKDSLTNHGLLSIIGAFTNDGLVLGNGKYEVSTTFTNNNVFKAGRGRVTLNGNDQNVNGDSITTFFDLVIMDTSAPYTGIKHLKNTIYVKNILHLNDCELAGEQNDIYILNSNRHAIKRGTGFISNTSNGRLYRVMNLTQPYLFPVGSSEDTLRYRPVEITPTTKDSTLFAVRLVNHSADKDGYDRSKLDNTLCYLNPLYYHLIEHPYGTEAADITIYFDATKDGTPWNTLSHWQGGVTSLWQSMVVTKAVYFPTTGFLKEKWSNFVFQPFILAETTPDSIPVYGDKYVCSDVIDFPKYTAWGKYSTSKYYWSFTGGTYDDKDKYAQGIYVNWKDAGSHTMSVYEKMANSFCNSRTSHFTVYVNPKPEVDFTITSEYGPRLEYFVNDLISFTNASKNDTTYYWTFNDGYTSTQKSPYHMFENPGTYTIGLQVVSDSGCVDTTSKVVLIKQGIYVPNIFTPNGDGDNDLFVIRNSGLVDYSIVIYDRWGVIVFESLNATMHWDGRTPAGRESAEGTYYYILKAKTQADEFDEKGYLTLLR